MFITRLQQYSLSFAVVLFALALTACGGGGGGGGGGASTTTVADRIPSTFSFTDQTGVMKNTEVTSAAITVAGINAAAVILVTGGAYQIGSGSFTSDAGTVTNGQTVQVKHTSSSKFSTAVNTTLTIGGVSDVFTSTTNTSPNVSGRVTFDYVPVVISPNVSLDYLAMQALPARGVTVQLIEGNSTVIGTDSTDVDGAYSINVDPGKNVYVRVRSQMFKAPSGWDIKVVDNTQSDAIYAMDSSVFSTSLTDVTLNLHADSGWTGSSYGESRVAAPFALLDVVYEAMQLVLQANSIADFPALVLYWSPNNVKTSGDKSTGHIGGTHYLRGSGGGIFLLGKEDNDTDEYDRHVIAHEWGHYFEDSFSRMDSIGGPHTLNDYLDMRVAFGEGFGNAISGMITADNVYKDTRGPQQGFGFGLSLEDSPESNPGWYNELSVQEILWDLFDPANDDPIELGFNPIYQVLVNEHKNTPALTSIFSFITALKKSAGMEAEIDTLLQAHMIATITDEYGAGRTNPSAPTSADILPIYSDLMVDGSVVNVCSINEFGAGPSGAINKLGSRRFLKFTPPIAGDYTISVTTTDAPNSAPASTTPDPEIRLNLMGVASSSTGAPSGACSLTDLVRCFETTTQTLEAEDYVLEVYEWTNTNDNDDLYPPIGRTCFDVKVISS